MLRAQVSQGHLKLEEFHIYLRLLDLALEVFQLGLCGTLFLLISLLLLQGFLDAFYDLESRCGWVSCPCSSSST